MNVIILAGGQGTRMGGVDKASVQLNGRRLVDHLLGQLKGHDVIVVSPHLLPGVATTSEQPPFGGPVAGIAAGIAALDHHSDVTAILAVDAPHSAEMLPALQAALGTADVAVTVAADGWIQPLCAVWRTTSLIEALTSLGEVRDRPVKALLRQAATVVEVPGDGTEADYDTLGELTTLGEVELPRTR
ncbi:molybdenum cofactor guanylyltransferase [Corynebacterium gallinarum]|uniref:Molybdenum cofactor guanylyltransferase n=1 Tax=Corynebacterium gallinarum TaxID=2762214 RepID=A0A8I0HIC1_9CORY|nr:molybdenum cofactor guanylyltransferase [Corynebacterium gallinarum]MBD8030553.1 molybdenum cofactor guanylyltransferase [Corynebacterium gallinarum]